MSSANNLLNIGLGFLSSFELMQEKRKSKIIDRWELSKKMPRKKKKEIRKMLKIDWKIANIDIFSCL